MNEKKNCPYCGEEIMATAKKCKHCGEWIEETRIQDFAPQQLIETEPEVSTKEEKSISNGETSKSKGWFSYYLFRHINFKWYDPERVSKSEYKKFVILTCLSLFPLVVLTVIINQLTNENYSDIIIWILPILVVCLQAKVFMARVRDAGEKWWQLLVPVPINGAIDKPGTAVDPNVKWAGRDWAVVLLLVVFSAVGIMCSEHLRGVSKSSSVEYSYSSSNNDNERIDDLYTLEELEKEVIDLFNEENADADFMATNLDIAQQEDGTFYGSIEVISTTDDYNETATFPIIVKYDGETIGYELLD